MRATIIGGSGFIGTALARSFLADGDEVTVVDVAPPHAEGTAFVRADAAKDVPVAAVDGADAVLHLAGRNIFARWDAATRRAIMESRVRSTRAVVAAIAAAERKPPVFVCASAVGYYGDRGDENLDEASRPGRDFLSEVCVAWEREADVATALGVRTVRVRTAPVLGAGGMLGVLLPWFRRGLGGPLGSGRQWQPWISIDDIIAAYRFAAATPSIAGPVNACAPDLMRNTEFTAALAHAVRRPALIPIPRFALRLRYGGLADAIMASQKVRPDSLSAAGFRWRFPKLESALSEIIGNKNRPA